MDYEKQIDDYLNKAFVNFDITGLTTGIWVGKDSPLDSEGLSFERAYGLADMETGASLKTENYSHLASVSKTLTACAALMLVEEEKLSFNDKLSDLLPWIDIKDKRADDITFRHLITHTSGLPTVNDFAWIHPDIDSEALKRYALSDEVRDSLIVNAPEDNIFRYSDMGFEIIGNIIQEISGCSYEDFIRDRLFIPCGMDDTTMLVFERTEKGRSIDPDRATRDEISKMVAMDELLKSGLVMPHTKDGKKNIVRQTYYPYNRRHAPSSTLNSNIRDIKKWGEANINRTVLSPEINEKMWETQTVVQNNGEGMGLGWFIRTQNRFTFYGHEGMDDGFRSSFWICPELKLQVVLLANIDRAPLKKISRSLIDLLTLN